MRLWPLIVPLLLGCSSSENPGLALRVVVPQAALDRIGELKVTLESPSGPLPMQPDTSASGVLVHTDAGRIQLRFVPGTFALQPQFDVLLVPSGRMPLDVQVGGTMTERDGRLLGSAAPASVALDQGRRTRVTLSFQCVNAATCAPASEFDLATRTATVTLTGAEGDQLTPLSIGHFSTADPLRGDLVAAARGKAVYVFYGQNRSLPSPSVLDPGVADVKILAAPGEALGDAAATGDFDGDGIDDLVVTAQNGNDSQTPAGAGVAYVIPGTRLANPGTINLATDASIPRIFGSASQEALGSGVALAQVNSDRYADIIIGAAGSGAAGWMGASGAGRVYIIFGTPSPPATIHTHLGQQNRTLLGDVAGSPIGRTIAAADLDGDGLAEVVLGNFTESNRGAAYVVRGNHLSASMIEVGTSSYDVRILGGARSQLGWSVALANVDGQGAPELLVGARGAGVVYVFTDPLAGAPVQKDVSQGQFELALLGPDGSLFGHGLAAGKLDGDAASDLLLGAPGSAGPDGMRTGAGACFVVRGTQLGTLTPGGGRQLMVTPALAAMTIYGARARDELGSAVLLGNYDVSDPLDEIVAGAPKGGTNLQGVVYGIQDLP